MSLKIVLILLNRGLHPRHWFCNPLIYKLPPSTSNPCVQTFQVFCSKSIYEHHVAGGTPLPLIKQRVSYKWGLGPNLLEKKPESRYMMEHGRRKDFKLSTMLICNDERFAWTVARRPPEHYHQWLKSGFLFWVARFLRCFPLLKMRFDQNNNIFFGRNYGFNLRDPRFSFLL